MLVIPLTQTKEGRQLLTMLETGQTICQKTLFDEIENKFSEIILSKPVTVVILYWSLNNPNSEKP